MLALACTAGTNDGEDRASNGGVAGSTDEGGAGGRGGRSGSLDARGESNGGSTNAAGAGGVAGSNTPDARSADAPRDSLTPSADGCGQPPAEQLYVWLAAGQGVTADAQGVVSAWKNLAGTQVAVPAQGGGPKGRPTLVKNALNGNPIIRFRGDPSLGLDPQSDLLQMPAVTVKGDTELTLVVVNASGKRWLPAPEWCMRATPTGCSSTYQWVFGWNGVESWSGVFLSPRDEEVGFRFGIGKGIDHHCFVGDKVSAADPCMKYPRPASIGTKFSVTVAVHTTQNNRIYVDGRLVHEAPIPHGLPAVSSDPPLNIGNNTFAHNGGGDLAEAMVYRRALPQMERAALEDYLLCKYLPERRIR
ncbi:MAG: LamG-like jellyroll fold domain-containing protein [Deltaproteobacteria bacterium]|nr:LamG-like jellyroll fold domain-containing protein [Deltaproteobacteria bacterium]